jgi:elongation factor P
MVTASQLRCGVGIKFQGQRYRIVAAEYHPGQGQMGGVTHARLQNLDTGTFWEHSFRADLKVEEIPVEKQAMEFLYADGQQCCFMNPETFEQTEIPRATVGAKAAFLESGMRLNVEFVDSQPVSVLFPDVLEVKIADTAPPMHQTADATFKTAKLSNGLEVLVPQFVKTGDTIRLDLETMKYMDRVKTDVKSRGA